MRKHRLSLLGDHSVSSGEKIQAKIQQVTNNLESVVIQGGETATSPTGSGRRGGNVDDRNEKEGESRGERKSNCNGISIGHSVVRNSSAMFEGLAPSPTGSISTSSRDDVEDTSSGNRRSTAHRNSDLSIGERVQAKIRRVAHLSENSMDAMVQGVDDSFEAVAKSSNARNINEEDRRKIQESHIAIESDMSGEIEIRLRSEESVRLINSSVIKETTTESQEPLDLALTLLRVCFHHGLSDDLKLQVRVIDDRSSKGGSCPDLDVTIQVTQDKTDSMMILGGKQNCHKFLSFTDSKLYLKLFRNGGKDVLHESFTPLFWLLPQRKVSASVNRWVDLRQSKGKSLGKIQLRLVPDVTSPTLHKLESCKVLTPGPEMALTPMKSYALRKKAFYSVAPVFLHVYDVSKKRRVQHCNYCLKAVGAGGIFHSAVEIYGKEWSFGGTENRRLPVTGVFSNLPKRCPVHNYRESVYLGDCELSKEEVEEVLSDLKPQWLARDYQLFHKNCNFFTQELAIQLGVGNIPEWVYSLAETGQQFEPYLQAYMNGEKGVKQKATDAPKPKTDAEEAMLDHAMASRIQRSFRKKKRSPKTAQTPQQNSSKTALDHAMASWIPKSFQKKQLKTASNTRKPRSMLMRQGWNKPRQ